MSKEIREEDLIVKTTFETNLNNLDVSKVLYGFQGLDPGSDKLPEGVHYVRRKSKNVKEILYRLIDNPYRYDGKDEKHCNDLGRFIGIKGYDYSQPPPVIEFIPNGIRDKGKGKKYFYLCYSGAQRSEALLDQNIDKWIYDEYRYDSDKARQWHIAGLNGSHPPALVSSPMDAINHSVRLINEEKLDVGELEKFIEIKYPSLSDQDGIISKIKKQYEHRDEAILTSKDVKTEMNKQGLGVGGKVINGYANWACKEGYEDRRAIQSLLKYWKDGIKSIIYLYVNGSTSKESLSEKRWKTVDAWSDIESALVLVFEEWKKTGEIVFHWDIKGFISQRNKECETGILTHDQIEPRKLLEKNA